MREIRTFVVDGDSYQISDWSVDKANGYFIWILKTLGEGVAGLIGSDMSNLKDIMESEISNGKLLQEFITALTTKVEEADIIKRSREICEGLVFDKKPVQYEKQFQGRLLHLYKVMFQVLRAQFSDFLDAGQGSVSALADKMT